MSLTFVSPEPAQDTQDTISNTFFFPDLSLQEYREDMRVDGTVTPERLRKALRTAIAEVNAELFVYRENQQGAGYTSLADVPAEKIDGISQRVTFYKQAVFSWARATLMEKYRDYDATAEGVKKSDALDEAIGEVWRNAHWAINGVQDRTHMTVELI